MSNLADLGRVLLLIGGGIVLLGLILVIGGRIPWLGHLPGDISVRRDNVSFFFPFATFLLLSVMLTVVVNLVLFLLRKH
jgi:hypothetical protein